MVETATIEKVGESDYKIKGVLNLKTINRLREEADPIIAGESEQIQVDLSDTIVKGIAGLALLSSLVRSSRRSGKTLLFVNPSSSLLNLAQANSMCHLLGFGSQEASPQ